MEDGLMLLVVSLGFALGIVMGAAARFARFCTLGAIADAVIVGDHRRLRAWILAIAVAIAGTQTLDIAGMVDIGQSIYLANGFGWLGALLGGLMFGLGMALVGTCGYGTLIRLGGGDLRALVDMSTLGFFAFVTMSGPLAYLRQSLIEPTNIAVSGEADPAIPEMITHALGLSADAFRPIVVTLIVVALLFHCFRDRSFHACHKEIAAAVIIGLAIVAGWLATGMIGHDAFDPKPPASFTFVRPLGDGMLYFMLMSGMSLNFGIASVAGVLVGAHLVARAKDELRREGFDGDREMIRHLIGSALMGIGGVMALGCTIGQGITGMSTLALSAPLALIAIFFGATLGLRYLEEGTFAGAFRVLAGKGQY